MANPEQRKAFMRLRDLCKSPKSEKINGQVFSKGDEQSQIYNVLEKTGALDVEYASHLEGKDVYALMAQPGKLTFQECCTILTFLLRAEHWAEGTFTEALMNGSVYKLLSRAVEAM